MKRIERQVFLCLLRLAWGSAKRSGLEDRRCAQSTETQNTSAEGTGYFCVIYHKSPVSAMYNLISANKALVRRCSRSFSLLSLKPQQVDTRHRSRHMGPVHDFRDCLIMVEPTTQWDPVSSVSIFFLICDYIYIGQLPV